MTASETLRAARLAKAPLAVGAMVMFSAFAQSPADLIGWQGLLWGTPKDSALKRSNLFMFTSAVPRLAQHVPLTN